MDFSIFIEIGEGKIGTDEAAFVEILAHAGQRQAYLIFEEYKKLSGKTIEQAMTSEMSGELLNGLLAMGIIQQLGKKKFFIALFLRWNELDCSENGTQPTQLLCGAFVPGHEGARHG